MSESTQELTDANDAFPKIGAPATRALHSAGYTRLSELAEVSDAELLKLHGFGPKALRIVREALAKRETDTSRH